MKSFSALVFCLLQLALVAQAQNFPFPNDRENFLCKTSTNAAKMYLQAKIYTHYYSKIVRVEITHISTFRDEHVLITQAVPTQKTPELIVMKDDGNSSPFPGINSLNMTLKRINSKYWSGNFSFPVGFPVSKIRKYEMTCLKH